MAARAPDYSFMRRPIWIAGHLLAIAGILGFVSLGFWQLRRLDERRSFNTLIETRLGDSPGSLEGLIGRYGTDPEALRLRRITVSGRYDTAAEVILRSRSYLGQPGNEILTPLVLADGSAIIVDRGWVPLEVGDPPVAGAEPPAETVTVTGILYPTEVRGSFGPVDPPTGTLLRVSRVDIARLQQQVGPRLFPMYVALQTQEPAQTDFPRALIAPTPDAGPHLSYAVQWFLFAVVTAVGYPILMYRTARKPQPTRSDDDHARGV